MAKLLNVINFYTAKHYKLFKCYYSFQNTRNIIPFGFLQTKRLKLKHLLLEIKSFICKNIFILDL